MDLGKYFEDPEVFSAYMRGFYEGKGAYVGGHMGMTLAQMRAIKVGDYVMCIVADSPMFKTDIPPPYHRFYTYEVVGKDVSPNGVPYVRVKIPEADIPPERRELAKLLPRLSDAFSEMALMPWEAEPYIPVPVMEISDGK